MTPDIGSFLNLLVTKINEKIQKQVTREKLVSETDERISSLHALSLIVQNFKNAHPEMLSLPEIQDDKKLKEHENIEELEKGYKKLEELKKLVPQVFCGKSEDIKFYDSKLEEFVPKLDAVYSGELSSEKNSIVFKFSGKFIESEDPQYMPFLIFQKSIYQPVEKTFEQLVFHVPPQNFAFYRQLRKRSTLKMFCGSNPIKELNFQIWLTEPPRSGLNGSSELERVVANDLEFSPILLRNSEK